MLLQQNLQMTKTITCITHKRQKATHICIDLNCTHNPIVCQFCYNDPKYRNNHIHHETLLKPVPEAIDFLSNLIKNQTKTAQSIYQRTIGNKENEFIRLNLEKNGYMVEDVQKRIQNLKAQVDLELEMLIKDFQKQVLLQKQEFLKRLEQYKKVYIGNIQHIKRQCFDLVTFQNSLKYYHNSNNITLKLISESQRKSLQWLTSKKKTLQKMTTILENPQYPSTINLNLGRLNRNNMLTLPFWKGQRKQIESYKQLKGWLKNSMNGWVQIPNIVQLDTNRNYQHVSYKTLQQYYHSG